MGKSFLMFDVYSMISLLVICTFSLSLPLLLGVNRPLKLSRTYYMLQIPKQRHMHQDVQVQVWKKGKAAPI